MLVWRAEKQIGSLSASTRYYLCESTACEDRIGNFQSRLEVLFKVLNSKVRLSIIALVMCCFQKCTNMSQEKREMLKHRWSSKRYSPWIYCMWWLFFWCRQTITIDVEHWTSASFKETLPRATYTDLYQEVIQSTNSSIDNILYPCERLCHLVLVIQLHLDGW